MKCNQTQEALKMAISAMQIAASQTKLNFNDTIQACKEALEQPVLTGTWIRYNDGDDTKRLALELDIAMNGIDGAAKSPALIYVLSQAVDYFKSGKKYHVLPIDDIEEHNESDSCKCNPLIEIYELDKVIIHNSFDSRELNEQPAKMTQNFGKNYKARLMKMDIKTQEALKMAIEALAKHATDESDEGWQYIEAIQACKDALEQPAQQYRNEPEALRAFHNAKVIRVESGVDIVATWDGKQEKCDIVIKPIAQPQPRMFLDLSNSNGNHPVEQPAQEPFGYWHVGETEEESDFFLYEESGDVTEYCDTCIKLYTSLPAREPLSEKQLDELIEDDYGVPIHLWYDFARAIEKAHGIGE